MYCYLEIVRVYESTVIIRELIKLFFILISYSLEDLIDDRVYLVFLNVSVCIESICDVIYVILNKMVFFK